MSWDNPQIPKMQRAQDVLWRQMHDFDKQIAFLYLQINVCYEKIKYYESQHDAFKVLYWEDLLTQCESVQDKLKYERDTLNKQWREDNDILVALMHADLNKSFGRLGMKSRFGQNQST